jgi:hypothetical protein
MNRPAFVALIESVLTNQLLWVDTVPEDETIPALTYNHVAGNGTRLLNGKKVNNWDTWRVRVVGRNRSECDGIVELLKPLDNTKSSEFRTVFVQSVQAVPSLPDDENESTFVDFKTFD